MLLGLFRNARWTQHLKKCYLSYYRLIKKNCMIPIVAE